MRNGKIIVGVICSTLVLGAMIMLSANGAWGEEKGITPGLKAPAPEGLPVQVNPADSTAKPKFGDISGFWKHHGIHYHSGGSMPEYKPDPNVDHKILAMKPDQTTNYTMQIIRPNPDMNNTFRVMKPGDSAKKAWKSDPGNKLADQPGDDVRPSDSGDPEKK